MGQARIGASVVLSGAYDTQRGNCSHLGGEPWDDREFRLAPLN